jgi:hypothetical protein
VNRGWLVWLIVVGLCGVASAAPTMTTSSTGTSLGTSHVGVASTTTQTITVTNAGTGTLSFTVASDNTDIVPSITSGTLGNGQSALVVVTMTPSARGTRSATITVAGNDAGNASDTFSVSGTGTSGKLVVTWTGSPGALDFGSALVAGGMTTRTVTISNPAPANEPLTFALDVPTGGADYAETTPASSTLAVGDSVPITITFDPSAVGTRTGTFSITSDDALSTGASVNLTGVGQGAIFTPSLASLDFGTVDVGTFLDKQLTITNTGNISAQVTSISSGNAAFTFTVTSPTLALPQPVAPGGTVEVTVRFTPVDGSIVTADLSIATQGVPATLTVPMTGDGLYQDVSITVMDEADLMIDLGASRVGVLVTKLVTVTNTGETSVTLALPTSNAAPCTLLPVLPATLPTVLAPAATATFQIRITPAAVGIGACTITVTTNIPTTDTIEIAYMGVASDVELVLPATGAINFGVVDVDSTELKSVVIGNDGTAPLNIGPCTITGSSRFTMVTSCTNLMVAPGATATLMLQFDPEVESAESAMVSFQTDALNTSEVHVALSGVGADQRIDLSALAVSFPDTPLADPAPPVEYIDVFNPTNPATGVAETLTISMVTSDAEVFVLANQGPFTVEPGAMIRLAVTFKPTSERTYDGTLVILSDASATPMATVALHGRGFAAEQQGGCCDSGRPSSAPLALCVLVLVIRRRRPRADVTAARR